MTKQYSHMVSRSNKPTQTMVNALDKFKSWDFTMGEFVEGVKTWLNDMDCMDTPMDTPCTLEQFVHDVVKCICDNRYCDN